MEFYRRILKAAFFFLVFFQGFHSFANDREVIDLVKAKKPFYNWSSLLEVGYFQPLGYYQELLNGAPLFLLKLRHNPKVFDYFLTDLEVGYAMSTFTNNSKYEYQLVPIGLALNYQYPLLESVLLTPKIGGGEYIYKVPEETVYYPYAKAGLDLSFSLSSNLNLSIGGNFYYLFDQKKPMSAVAGLFSVNYVFGTVLTDKDIKVLSMSTQRIFASIYPVYYNEPVGIIKLKNTSGADIKKLTASLYMEKYMDNKSTYEIRRVIRKDEEFQVPVYAYFNEKIKNLDNDTQTTGILEISYEKADGSKSLKRDVFKTRIYSKNALVWDSLAKLGTFISVKDRKIVEFSRQAMALNVPDAYQALPKEMLTLLKITEALKAYGIKYVRDPKSPYDDFGGQKISVDYVQFPRETLAVKAGDCDDLTVLFAALLESVELTTAFVTIPGHIFLMVRLDGSYGNIQNTVQYGGKNWVPFEVTALKDGFTTAWMIGYQNYQKHAREEVLLAEDAFKKYQPVLPDHLPQVAMNLDERSFEKTALQELKQMAALIRGKGISDVQLAGLSPEELNSEGIKLARTGNYPKAEEFFLKALEKKPKYETPYYNLMNLYRLQGKYDKVYEVYNKIQSQLPGHKKSMLLLSKIEFLRKNYKTAEDLYKLALKSSGGVPEGELLAKIKDAKESGRASDAYNVKVDWE